jgi:hypothetical protein
MTSTCLPDSPELTKIPMGLTIHLATVSMVALLMVIMYPVSEVVRCAYHYLSTLPTLTCRLC